MSPTTDTATAPARTPDVAVAALEEDRVVRGALRTFVHVRRYQKFYAAGAVWLVLMAMLPTGSPLRAPLLGPSGESTITPIDDTAAPTGPLATPPAPDAVGDVSGAAGTTPHGGGHAGGAGSTPGAGAPGGPPEPVADRGAAPGGDGSADALDCDLDGSLPAPVVAEVAGALGSALDAIASAAGQELPVDPVEQLGCTTTAPSTPEDPAARLTALAGTLDGLAGTMDGVALALTQASNDSRTAPGVHEAIAGHLGQLRLDLDAVGVAAGPVAAARAGGRIDDATVTRELAASHEALADATARADEAAIAAVVSMAAAGLPGGARPAVLPAAPVPEIPEELAPAMEALAPLVGEGCKGVGLVGVVVFLVGGTVDEVPTDDIYPLFEPLFLLCGQVPFPETSSTCGFDDASPVDDALGDVSGDVPADTPPVLGTLLDQLLAIEAAVADVLGQPLPASLAEQLSEQLDCRTRDLSDDSVSTSFGDEGSWSGGDRSDAAQPFDADEAVLGSGGLVDGELPATGGTPALLLGVALLALAGLALRRAGDRIFPGPSSRR